MKHGPEHTAHLAILRQRFGIKINQQTGRVTAGDTTGLFDLEKQLKALADVPGWLELVDLLAAGRRNVEDQVKYQSAKWELGQFTRTMGFIAGLEQVPAVMESVQLLAADVRERMELDLEEQTASQEVP